MESSVLRLHAYCSIGPHLVFAVLSLIYDTRAWYDTVAALAIVLPISALVIYLDFRLNLRGAVHCACIILGVIGQEVSRQSRSTDWNQLFSSEYLNAAMGITNVFKGAGTFIKLLPSITVISRISNYKIGWRDYVGWSISFISSVYLLQEPNIYRNDKAMAEWRLTFSWIETLHWFGLGLSASTYFNHGIEILAFMIAFMQPLLAYALNRLWINFI